MLTGEGDFKYNWIEDWATLPDSPSIKTNGRTHGVVVLANGNVAVFIQADPAVLIYNKDRMLVHSWGDNLLGAHGMTLINENETEYLWLTDQYSGEVIKTTLDGKVVIKLDRPSHNTYKEKEYSPTWIAIFEKRFGGNGDIWLSDGYGSNYVHRFDENGNYISSINGEEGKSGRFDCPHSLFIDYRKNEPELYIADRGNKRFQVYDLDGKYKREFGNSFLGCPCGGVVKENLLYVPELCARLAILDEHDKLITYLGRNEDTCDVPGWPDHPKNLIQAGKFNSPHHLAIDKDDNIYVVEWIVGGRIIKLEKTVY